MVPVTCDSYSYICYKAHLGYCAITFLTTLRMDSGAVYRCDCCPMTFLTKSGLGRHLLCNHARRFHRDRPSSPVPSALLDGAVRRAWMAQAKSGQRRQVRTIRHESSAHSLSASAADLLVDDFLAGWPHDPYPTLPSPTPRLVVREVATQHEVACLR